MELDEDKLIQIQDIIRECREDLEKKTSLYTYDQYHHHEQIHESLTASDFEPDEDSGDAQPSQEQLDYRAALLLLLLGFYQTAKKEGSKFIDGKSIDEVIYDLEKAAQTYTTKAGAITDDIAKNRWQQGWDTANKYLDRAGQQPVRVAKISDQLIFITEQQRNNVAAISERILERIKNSLYFDKVMDFYKEHGSSLNLDSIFKEAINRSESMSIFNYIESYKMGGLEVYEIAVNERAILIDQPWTTCEDNDNCTLNGPCPECVDLAENGPYPVDDFPDTPHDKCQCNDPLAPPIITVV